MTISLGQLKAWMEGKEKENLEFKEAKTRYDFRKLVSYCVALANERGGRLILGVTNKRPRKVVGSAAFPNLQKITWQLTDRLHLRISVEEVPHPDGRVVVFAVPSRPIGLPMQYGGVYWMRAGESLTPMTPDQIKRILSESGPDYSAEICPRASIDDLDSRAIERFRTMWSRKSGSQSLLAISDEQLLADAELVVDGGVTYAALILLATRSSLGRWLPQAEVVFEYRSTNASGPAQGREDYREGFLLFESDLWKRIDLRNELQSFQQGFLMLDIPTFNEIVVREAMLNAVSHRDYRLGGSVFVRQFPRRLEVVSPGGFPPGVTEENILWRQYPRNRRIAEVFAKCGLVERSGQGVNRMFEESIKECKPQPDFSGTDDYQVCVTLRGNVQDPMFLGFLQQIGKERMASYTTEDFLVLDLTRQNQAVPKRLEARLPALVRQGVVERVGRGRGTRYMLSQRFYGALGERGVYTRVRGLDRETNKALLLRHIRDNRKQGSPLRELCQVLPALTYTQVQSLLQELKREGDVHPVGRTKGARWLPGPGPSG